MGVVAHRGLECLEDPQGCGLEGVKFMSFKKTISSSELERFFFVGMANSIGKSLEI